ncbi:MAG TPA: autotransporter-associated beta strand repeat-containing protein [Verrucomicrobiae bacterium]
MKTGSRFRLCLFAGLALLGGNTKALAVGAVTPFTTIEAESGILGGGAVVRAFTVGSPVPTGPTMELEASGMGYVLLTNVNQSVSWTNPVANANAIVIRNCIPDAPGGGGITATINMYVDGIFRQSITLSSKQSWNYMNSTTTPDDPNGGGVPWHFYNEDRAFITGSPIAAGSVIMFREDAVNTAAFYDIDSIDLESVPAAKTQPAGSLSITSPPYSADPTFTTDSTTAIRNCINDARSQGKTVWIPPGKFMINSLASGALTLPGVTVEGAGVWYSMIYKKIPLPPPTTPWRSHIQLGTNSVLRDVSIDSDAIYRSNGGLGGDDYGIDSNGTNWLVERVWIQHCDANWMSGNFSTIRDSRVADSWADGINLNNGNSPANQGFNLTASNNFVRGCGDDGIATYSDAGPNGDNTQMRNTTIVNNTSIAPYWANGLRIAGGSNVTVQGNLIDSVSANNGMEVGIFGDTGQPLDSALVTGNVILRGGGWNSTDRHGMHVGSLASGSFFPNSYTRAIITNNIIRYALRDGLKIGTTFENLTVSHNLIDQPAQIGVHIQSGVTGTGAFDYNLVTNQFAGKVQYQNDSTATFLTTHLSNSWTFAGALIKSDTPTMNLAADWSGTAPAAGQTGEFDNTISAANASALTLGGNVTLDGLVFFNNMNGPVTVAAGNTLTLATSAGLSMAVANADVTLNCQLSASTFNIAGERTLTLGGGSATFLSGSSAGLGTILLSATSAKTFTTTGNPSVSMGTPATEIGGVVISNNCTLTDSGSFIIGNSGASGLLTLDSPTASFKTIGGAGVIMVGRNGGATIGKLVLANGTLDTSASTVGAGIIVGCQFNNSTASGLLDIRGGAFILPQILDIGSAMSAGSGSVTMEGGTATVGTIDFGGANGSVGAANSTGGSGSLTLTGGALYVGSGGINSVGTGTFTSTRTVSGGLIGATADWLSPLPFTLATVGGSITFQASDSGSAAHNIILSGVLSGTGGLIKTGNGTLTLVGANSYTGGTTINAGTLSLTTTNNPAMLYTNIGGTLKVLLAKTNTSLPANGLACGNNSPQLTFDLASLGPTTTPLMTVTGNLSMNGNVTINASNVHASATSLLLTYTGTRAGTGNFVAGNLPLGASIIDDWVTKKVSLAYSPPGLPMISRLNYGASNIEFSGTNGTPSITFRLLCSTNLAAPLGSWLALATNSFDASGNFDVTVPMTAGSTAMFYRLEVP